MSDLPFLPFFTADSELEPAYLRDLTLHFRPLAFMAGPRVKTLFSKSKRLAQLKRCRRLNRSILVKYNRSQAVGRERMRICGDKFLAGSAYSKIQTTCV